jgi:3-dehydroquinate synthase
MHTIRVNLGERSYDISVGTEAHSSIGLFARQRARGSQALIVGDTNVQKHAESIADSLSHAGFVPSLFILPSGEQQKSLVSASALYDQLAERQADRRTLIVAVGGGVIGDLAGFVAATYARGLPLLMVPTTLLSMVDSSVGGKVGVNHPKAKNLIGAFHQPAGVWIDTAYLDTLPDREYRSGLAEVVKYGVILDADFFAYLERQATAILTRVPEALRTIIARCCRLKADIVEKDEREETGLRMILNYGHTFAHAFETVAGYGAWLHGEAVAAGMICASRLAKRRGMVDSQFTERQGNLLAAFGLPTTIGPWSTDALLQCMRSDKKSVAGRLRFILPRRIGEVVVVDDVPEGDVCRVLEESQKDANASVQ